jgi:mono/diheme cytochrome c family protein
MIARVLAVPSCHLRLLTIPLGVALVWHAGCGESSPTFTEPQVLGGQAVSAEELNRGARAYHMKCASCHGYDGSGKGPGSGALKFPPRDFREADFAYKSGEGLPSDDDLRATIRNGRLDRGMPPWPQMSEEDLRAVVQFIKTFSPKWKQAATARPVPDPVAQPNP